MRSARAAATRSTSRRPRRGKAFEIASLPLEKGRTTVLAFLGATGVGKTTSLAKLSARLAHAGRRVAIATLDGGRVGALEQIRAFGESIGVPAAALDDPGRFARDLSVHGPARRRRPRGRFGRPGRRHRRARGPPGASMARARASRSSPILPAGAAPGRRERRGGRRDPRAHRRDRHEDRRDGGAAPGHGARGRPRPRDRLPVQRARHRAPLPPRVRRAVRRRRPHRRIG